MKPSFDADERTGTDLALFAIGFLGFLLGVAGIILRVASVASIGFFLLAVAFVSFLVKRAPGE